MQETKASVTIYTNGKYCQEQGASCPFARVNSLNNLECCIFFRHSGWERTPVMKLDYDNKENYGLALRHDTCLAACEGER